MTILRKEKYIRKEVPLSIGDSLAIVSSENFNFPYPFVLYLGADASGPEKILMASYVDGFLISDLSVLEEYYRFLGHVNIESEILKGDVQKIEYNFYECVKNEGTVTYTVGLEKENDIWSITKQPKLKPTWMEYDK